MLTDLWHRSIVYAWARSYLGNLGLTGTNSPACNCGGIMASANRSIANDRAAVVPAKRWEELCLFLLLTVVLAPVLAVMTVGGYGFLVWMYQLVAGPPGAPAL